eukprot:5857182-Alexandrium_andersonii.AAC.1
MALLAAQAVAAPMRRAPIRGGGSRPAAWQGRRTSPSQPGAGPPEPLERQGPGQGWAQPGELPRPEAHPPMGHTREH